MQFSTLNAGLVGGALLAMAGSTYAAIDYSTNLALATAGGTARTGYATANDGSAGTAYVNSTVGGGLQNNTIDGILGSRVDTWMLDKDFATSGGFYDFSGVSWAATKDNVASVRVYMHTLIDGGWFDRPGLSGSTDNDTLLSGAGSGGVAQNISIDPKIQYTLNGTTWIDVTGSSSDYDTVVTNGLGTASQTALPAITFTFTPVSSVLGIRVFGDGADVNNAAGSNQAGFISVAEFQVFADPAVPEPTTLGLLSVGALAVLRRHRRSR